MRTCFKKSGWPALLAAVLLLFVSFAPAGAEGAEAMENVFALLEGRTFHFLSGAGGWSTELVILPDGSFTGYFHDSDIGFNDEDYPNGTLYECRFSGSFVQKEKAEEFSYVLKLTSLHLEEEPGVESISNGVRRITEEAYGISGGDEFMLYCPGRLTLDLPEAYLEWVGMALAWEEEPEALPFWGLYNINEETGFYTDIPE